MTNSPPVISVRDVVVHFGGTTVLDRASVDVFEGEILGFVGGSGAGKSVLMRAIIGLVPKQQGALFSSLTALQNVPLDLEAFAARDQPNGQRHERRLDHADGESRQPDGFAQPLEENLRSHPGIEPAHETGSIERGDRADKSQKWYRND